MKGKASLSKPKHLLSGILYLTAASLAFSLMVVCVKLSTQTLPVQEVVFFRSLIGTLWISFLIVKKGVSFWGKDYPKLVLRGTSGFIALALHFFTISKLPLGTAVMLNYTAPIFAVVLALVFLRERPGLFQWSMISLCFIGVYLLTGVSGGKPATAMPVVLHQLYVSLGLLSGLFAGIAYTSIRAIKHRESPLTIIFYFTLISTVGSSLFLFEGSKWPGLREWVELSGVGIGSFYGQLWMTIAFRRAPASLVSPFTYLTPTFAFLLGFLIWQDSISFSGVAGAALIILAGSWISLKEAAYD